MGRIPSNRDDFINSQDVLTAIEDLKLEREALGMSFPDEDELAALEALEEEAGNSRDWHYGETLIADHYFEEYAREVAADIGLVTGDENWPICCIDWKQAAEELQQDYFDVDFGGVTYWIRS